MLIPPILTEEGIGLLIHFVFPQTLEFQISSSLPYRHRTENTCLNYTAVTCQGNTCLPPWVWNAPFVRASEFFLQSAQSSELWQLNTVQFGGDTETQACWAGSIPVAQGVTGRKEARRDHIISEEWKAPQQTANRAP